MKNINWSNLLVKGTEWFARLAVLNLAWILFSFPLFTIIPATYTLFSILNIWNSGEKLNESVFLLFKNIFVSSFKKSYRFGLPFIVVGMILIINLLFFFTTTNPSAFFFILKVATIILAILYVFLFFYSFALSAFVKGTLIDIIWTAFIIMLSQPIYTGMIGLSMLLSTIIFDFFPALLFFFSISVIGLSFLKVTKKGYRDLILKAKQNKYKKDKVKSSLD